MSACKGHIFISFPSMSTMLDTDLIFTETVSQLIQRLLMPFGIKDFSIFNLYGSSKNFRKIQPNEFCYTLFASEYEKFFILQSNCEEIDVFFENKHGFINHVKSMSISSIAETAMCCFSISRDSSFYVFYDPTTNSIISMKNQCISRTIIIKAFHPLVPGMVFDLNTITKFDTKSLTIEDMSRVLFTKSMHHLLRSLREHRKNLFEIACLNPSQINKCLDSFKNESRIADLTHQEQTSFLFMLLSSGDQLISADLQQLAIDAMDEQSDISRLEMVKIFILYMPFSTHMLLIELVQIYGGGYENFANHEEAMSILTETFFRRIINREKERKFITFMFLFYQSLVPLEKDAKSQSKICILGQKLVLFDYLSDNQRHAFTTEGPSDIKMEQTVPLKLSKSLKEILSKYVKNDKEAVPPNQGNNENSTQKCISLYKSISQKLKANFPKEVLYPFCDYLDDLNLDDHKIIS